MARGRGWSGAKAWGRVAAADDDDDNAAEPLVENLVTAGACGELG